MSGFSPVPGDKFTDEMLSKNFMAIADGFVDLVNRNNHLGDHVAELYEMVQAASKVKKPSRIKPFLLGAVVGVAAYRYVKKNGHKPIVAAVNNWAEDAKEKVEDVATAPRD